MKKLPFLLILLILASSCTPAVSELTPPPILSPLPSDTVTPVISINNFDVKRMPVGTHGNMACMTYQGESSDLRHVSFSATFKQEEKTIQNSVEPEAINNQLCFEMIDFLFAEDDVELILEAKTTKNSEIFIDETNRVQNYDLGMYLLVPSLSWLFGDNGLDKNVGGGFRNGHRQWDLAFSSDAYPNSVGTPIYAPSDGYIVNYTDSVPGRNGAITNLQAYLPYLGIIFNVGHINPENHLEVGEYFNEGDIIAVIDSNQPGSSRPHTHLGINTTEIPPRGSPWSALAENNWLNPFLMGPLSRKQNLSTGLWIPESLPQKVQDLFEQNYFEKHTFIEYVPLISTN